MTLFGDDPLTFFAGDPLRANYLSRPDREALQLECAAGRLALMGSRIAPLAAMLQVQNIRGLDNLADLAALLFPQNFYKAYDETMLLEGDFAGMTQWLQRLTTRPLTSLAGRSFATLDDWLDTVERDAGLRVIHTSGTSGRLGFMPRSTAEVDASFRRSRRQIPDWSGRAEDGMGEAPFAVIWAGFATGYSAIVRAADVFRLGFARRPELFFPTMSGRISADWHWFMMQVERAHAAGTAAPPPASYVLDRIDEMEASRNGLEANLGALLDRAADELRGSRILLAGPPVLLHQLATAGLQRGLRGLCGPGSVIATFGGMKRHGPIPDMERTIRDFAGPAEERGFYAMTEVNGTNNQCEKGQFHISSTLIPFLLDPQSGALLPRDGKRNGRMAFFDCMAQAHWGGIATSDIVTLDWNPCSCGRTTPTVTPDIRRIEDPHGIAPPLPGNPDGLAAAMDVLEPDDR